MAIRPLPRRRIAAPPPLSHATLAAFATALLTVGLVAWTYLSGHLVLDVLTPPAPLPGGSYDWLSVARP